MEKKYDVVIIGGGPAGYSAALYCTRAGLSTLVLEMLSAGGQMATTTQVENYPGFNEGIDGFDLAEKMLAGAERFGAVSEFAEVTALHLAENPKRIVTSDGEVLARAVILATGAVPKKLGLPGEDDLVGRGVAYCATCDGMYFKGKTEAVATLPPRMRKRFPIFAKRSISFTGETRCGRKRRILIPWKTRTIWSSSGIRRLMNC